MFICNGYVLDVVAQWLRSASDLGPEDREFEPWPARLRCVLRQNT